MESSYLVSYTYVTVTCEETNEVDWLLCIIDLTCWWWWCDVLVVRISQHKRKSMGCCWCWFDVLVERIFQHKRKSKGCWWFWFDPLVVWNFQHKRKSLGWGAYALSPMPHHTVWISQHKRKSMGWWWWFIVLVVRIFQTDKRIHLSWSYKIDAVYQQLGRFHQRVRCYTYTPCITETSVAISADSSLQTTSGCQGCVLHDELPGSCC